MPDPLNYPPFTEGDPIPPAWGNDVTEAINLAKHGPIPRALGNNHARGGPDFIGLHPDAAQPVTYILPLAQGDRLTAAAVIVERRTAQQISIQLIIYNLATAAADPRTAILDNSPGRRTIPVPASDLPITLRENEQVFIRCTPAGGDYRFFGVSLASDRT